MSGSRKNYRRRSSYADAITEQPPRRRKDSEVVRLLNIIESLSVDTPTQRKELVPADGR